MYALVLAPAVWILCGVGFDQDLTGRARDNGGLESLSGVLLLLLAGAAYAILLLSPISPLGPLLAGLTFAGVSAWARIAPESYAGVWPADVTSDGFNLSTPGYGLALLLAVPLLVTALSARRWRAYEPPEFVLLGTIGRARGAASVAGTTMASERTTVIPQQRTAPAFVPGFGGTPFGGPSATDDHDERTTVLPLGRPAAHTPAPGAPASGAPSLGAPSASLPEAATQVVGTDSDRTVDVSAEQPTQGVAVCSAVADGDRTGEVTGDETTRFSLPTQTDPAASEDSETTRLVTGGDETISLVLPTQTVPGADDGGETTSLVLPTAAGPVSDDGDEKTEMLTLPAQTRRDQSEADSERTQVVRAGTVEPPGDRTQLLTFPPAPTEPATVTIPAPPEPDAGRTSIVVAERPDPAEDPTTRLTAPTGPATETPTKPVPERRTPTATSLERPADEAADDTRPLTLPAQRPPTEDEPTRPR